MPRSKTLRPDEIATARPVDRRSALSLLGATLAGAGAFAATALREGEAHGKISDRDRGPHRDPAGHGHSGFTDRDGAHGDSPGRGVCPERGWTDHDAGPGGDPPSRGRGPCH